MTAFFWGDLYGFSVACCFYVLLPQTSLLKFVLARWCPDVVPVSRFLQVAVILGGDVVILGAPNLSFGMPVASSTAPWGIIEPSRGTWEHKKGDCGPRLGFLSIVIVRAFGAHWTTKCVFSCLSPGRFWCNFGV